MLKTDHERNKEKREGYHKINNYSIYSIAMNSVFSFNVYDTLKIESTYFAFWYIPRHKKSKWLKNENNPFVQPFSIDDTQTLFSLSYKKQITNSILFNFYLTIVCLLLVPNSSIIHCIFHRSVNRSEWNDITVRCVGKT